MITLWGRANSINVQKALWALDELGLDYQHVPAGGDAGGLDEPAFRAMNPNGRVPVLMDGEAAIWESNAIVGYLCAAYAPDRLCALEPSARARQQMWMDWTATTLQPPVMDLFWGYWRTPAARRDAGANGRLATAAARTLMLLDRQLSQRPFVAGDDFSMADIPAGTLMHRCFGMGVAMPDVPHLHAWRARLAERKPYRERVMTPFDDLHGRLAF
ncbi:MAG TPA: glutathione S-transferase family protein [Caulobacteraceae bacterium]